MMAELCEVSMGGVAWRQEEPQGPSKVCKAIERHCSKAVFAKKQRERTEECDNTQHWGRGPGTKGRR